MVPVEPCEREKNPMNLSDPATPKASGVTRWIIRHPVPTLVILAVLTLAFSWYLPKLSFRTSVYDLVIEDLPETVAFKAYQETFGADDLIRIVFSGKNVFDPVDFAHLKAISEKVGSVKGVRRVISLPEIKKVIDLAGEQSLETFEALITPVPMFEKNLISKDHRRTILTLVLATDADRDQVILNIEKIIQASPAGTGLYQIGMPLVSRALVQLTQKDFLRIPPLTLLIIALLVWVLYRNFHPVFLSLACVAMALAWTFGLMAATGVPLSMMTMIVPVFIIAVGMAYCLYICSDYLLSARQAASPADAVQLTFANVTLPTTLAVITTVIGIGSMLINKMTAVREFALFSCFGMTSLLVITLTLFPAMLVLIPLPKRGDGNQAVSGLFDRFLAVMIHMDLNYQKITLPVLGAVVVFCAAGAFRVRVETNPLQYFKENTDIRRHFFDIYQDLSGSFPVNVVLVSPEEDYFETPAHAVKIEQLQKYLDTLPGVDKTLSFVDYLKLVNYASNGYNLSFYALPGEDFEMRMLINNFKSLLGEDMLRQFMSPPFNAANILLLTHISSSEEFLRLRAQIAGQLKAPSYRGVLGEVTGFSMAVSASSHVLTTGQTKSLLLSLGLIFAIMLLLFLSSKVGLIAMLPNFFPIIVNFGFMGWLGIPLSIATSLVSGIAIGLAVDNTIHYLVRYNREFKKDLDKDRALTDTVRHVGKPIIFTTLTISVGFSVLIFSNFQPTAVFGMLMVVTMVSALVGNLMLLPSLMRHVELVTAWDLLRMIPTLGGMSAGMIHELNQPLNAIKMGSDFLRMITRKGAMVAPEQIYQVADEISRQVDRVSGMIRRLGDLEDRQEFTRGKIDINEPVRETLAIIGHQFALENIAVTLDLGAPLPPIYARKPRLAQMVYNLLVNAGEAIMAKPQSGEAAADRTITIRTHAEKDRVVLTVTDTGSGVPAHLIDRITEPFFTTKETGKGKGLGLAISQEIVRAHGGRMKIESVEGSFTRVRVSFPAWPEKERR
ncbi:MAG: MMPL family transporter [Desulfobacterales bacterium]|jgi:predicted RND superfamily exporter protein/nitrogen-specific signal transduction histidine kinase|nr:MMPL family transporter [Desulfobacterales bacterium]